MNKNAPETWPFVRVASLWCPSRVQYRFLFITLKHGIWCRMSSHVFISTGHDFQRQVPCHVKLTETPSKIPPEHIFADSYQQAGHSSKNTIFTNTIKSEIRTEWIDPGLHRWPRPEARRFRSLALILRRRGWADRTWSRPFHAPPSPHVTGSGSFSAPRCGLPRLSRGSVCCKCSLNDEWIGVKDRTWRDRLSLIPQEITTRGVFSDFDFVSRLPWTNWHFYSGCRSNAGQPPEFISTRQKKEWRLSGRLLRRNFCTKECTSNFEKDLTPCICPSLVELWSWKDSLKTYWLTFATMAFVLCSGCCLSRDCYLQLVMRAQQQVRLWLVDRIRLLQQISTCYFFFPCWPSGIWCGSWPPSEASPSGSWWDNRNLPRCTHDETLKVSQNRQRVEGTSPL